MSVFVHAQGIKTVHAGGRGVKKWQNSVHVVVEYPLKGRLKLQTPDLITNPITLIYLRSLIFCAEHRHGSPIHIVDFHPLCYI